MIYPLQATYPTVVTYTPISFSRARSRRICPRIFFEVTLYIRRTLTYTCLQFDLSLIFIINTLIYFKRISVFYRLNAK